jgi:hypothetical protein
MSDRKGEGVGADGMSTEAPDESQRHDEAAVSVAAGGGHRGVTIKTVAFPPDADRFPQKKRQGTLRIQAAPTQRMTLHLPSPLFYQIGATR